MLARNTAKLSSSPSNFSLRGEIALLYSLVAVAPVLGSSKSRMACERHCPNAKAGGAGATGKAGGGGGGVGRMEGPLRQQAGQEEQLVPDPCSLAVVVPVVHDEHVELMLR